jgi:nitrogen regulatory protein P-II 1/nitrogen regulatory protein P-II 2
MIKLELLVHKDKVIDVKEELTKIGIKKIVLIEAKEYDEENQHVQGYRGSTYIIEFSEKVKLEILLSSEELIETAVHSIAQANIEAEVFVYHIMQSWNLVHHKKGSVFSLEDEYEEMMSGSKEIRGV